MAGLRAEARGVDQRLRMLDAEAHGERFCLHVNTGVIQHLERVTRRVSQCHHDMIRANLDAIIATHTDNTTRIIRTIEQQLIDTRAETHFTAESDDGGAHVLDHRDQTERSDMRLGHIQNFFRRTRLHKLRQHLAAVMEFIRDLRIQLPIRKCPCTTLTKLHIRFRSENAFAPQTPRRRRAFLHRFTALNDDRLETHLRQHQSRKQSTRSHTDNNRPAKTHRRLPHHKLI